MARWGGGHFENDLDSFLLHTSVLEKNDLLEAENHTKASKKIV
jgi:hypothetical protein